MPTIVPTSLADVLLAIQARLVAWLAWDESRVLIDARSDHDHDLTGPTVADQYLRLAVKARTPDDASIEGRGRVYPLLRASLSCTLRTRILTDKTTADRDALTAAAARGHLRVEELLWDALLLFHPEDADGNWLLSEPIKPRSGAGPTRPPKGWTQSVIDFQVSLLWKLTQTYQ